MSKMYNVRIPDELDFKVEEYARVTERSRSYIIKKALESFIEEQSDYKIAMKRLLDKDDEIISEKAMRKKLGL